MKRTVALLRTNLFGLVFFNLLFSCTYQTSPVAAVSDFSRIVDSVCSQAAFSEKSKDLICALYNTTEDKTTDAIFKYYSFLCGYYHLTKGDQAKAMIYADSLLYFADHFSGDETRHDKKAFAHLSIGDIFRAQKSYNLAYYHYYLARAEAEKGVDQHALSEYSYRLGMVLYKKKQYIQAAQHFINAFNYSGGTPRTFADFCRLQEVLSNAGLSYTMAGKPDSAFFYYTKAADFISNNNIFFAGHADFYATARAVLDGNMALAYSTVDPEKATALFQKSILVNSMPGNDVHFALNTQLALATLYASLNLDEDCRATLQEIAKGLDTIPDNLVRQGFYKLNWQLYSKNNHVAAAYAWLQAYQSLTDSLNKDHSLTEADILGEINRKEAETRMQELLKDTTIARLQSIIAAIMLIVSLAFLLVLLRGRKRAKRYTQKLEILNSDNKDQNLRLQLAKESLEQKDREKDRLLQVIAHDLRNPIAGIKSLANLMKIEHGQDNDLRNVMDVMERGCTDALMLINNLLASSHKQELKKNNLVAGNVVNINKVVEYCKMLLSSPANEKNIRIETILPGIELYASADSPGLCRVISNLVTNAIKFSPSGKTITIKAFETDNQIQIEVHDQGIGIPDYMKTTLFSSSDNPGREGTQGEESHGMGLSICKEIIEGVNGKIWFDSCQDKGSSFFISLTRLKLPTQEKIYN